MIDKWWKWVLAILFGIVVVVVWVWAAFQLSDIFYGGDQRCILIRCVIVK
jgi:hypothetical protein